MDEILRGQLDVFPPIEFMDLRFVNTERNDPRFVLCIKEVAKYLIRKQLEESNETYRVERRT